MVSLPSSAIVLRKHQFTREHTPLYINCQSTGDTGASSLPARCLCHTHTAPDRWLGCQTGRVLLTSSADFSGFIVQKDSVSPFMESCADAAQNSFVWGSYGEHKRQKANAKLAFKYMLCLVLAPTTFTDRDKRGTSCKMRCGMTNVFRMWQQQQQHFGARALSHRREHCLHLR